MSASSINFKDVGRSSIDVQQQRTDEQSQVPIGIRTPLRYGTTSLFEMNTELFDQIRDNLRNLILTNWGERVGLYNFGANLSELSTERASREDYDQEIAARIKSAVDRWMSYVSLLELVPLNDIETSLVSRTRAQTVPIRRYLLTFEVPSINSPKQSLEILVGLT